MELVAVVCPDCGRKIASVDDTEAGPALSSWNKEREHVPPVVRPFTVLPADSPPLATPVSFNDSPDDLPLAFDECPKHGELERPLTLTLGEIRAAVTRARTSGKTARVPARRLDAR
jgi:hypothetical protein